MIDIPICFFQVIRPIMSPSFPADYDQQRQWNAAAFQQHHTAHFIPRFCSNVTPNSQFDAAYNSGTRAWHKSMVTVASDPAWPSEQYNAVGSPRESAYTEDDIQHSNYADEAVSSQHPYLRFRHAHGFCRIAR